MKTFRFVGTALIAVLLCVNFSACKGNDDDTDGTKKISKIVRQATDGKPKIATYTFNYDDKGRLVRATDSWDSGWSYSSYKYLLEWSDNAIVVTWIDSLNYKYTGSYTLELVDGLVFRNGENSTYTYNDSNRLIQCIFPKNKCTINWDNDKVVFVDDLDSGQSTLSYNGFCEKGYFPIMTNYINTDIDEVILMAHPEIVGIRTTQLPSNASRGGVIFSYEFDEDGYVTKIIREYTSGHSNGVIETYDITWE